MGPPLIASLNSSAPTPGLGPLHQGFLALLPRVGSHGPIFFRHLRCPHRKEGALQETWPNTLSDRDRKGGEGPMLGERTLDVASRHGFFRL